MEESDPSLTPTNKNVFHFKQFSVRHDRSSMKVGTDGILLGAWADVTNCTRILDIGTGTGLIALMLAQRTKSTVLLDGVEVQEFAYEDAVENVAKSPWKDRVTMHHSSIQQFVPNCQYDLIVSNPPYFHKSLKPPDENRRIARHADSMTFTELLKNVTRLLQPHGRFVVILPHSEGTEFKTLADHHAFFNTKYTALYTRKEKPVERLLLEFSKAKKDNSTEELVLYSQNQQWSQDYLQLTRDFYLKI